MTRLVNSLTGLFHDHRAAEIIKNVEQQLVMIASDCTQVIKTISDIKRAS